MIISAGHSGTDSGAVSADGKLREADLALWMRNRVATLLRADGQLRVLTDGSEGQNKPLRDAVQLVRANPGSIAIELHFNASANREAKGVEVLAKPVHRELAQSLAAAIANVTESPLRGTLGWKLDSAGQHHRLAFCEASGLIVEVEFISNPSAIARYLETKNEAATSIANALRDAAQGV